MRGIFFISDLCCLLTAVEWQLEKLQEKPTEIRINNIIIIIIHSNFSCFFLQLLQLSWWWYIGDLGSAEYSFIAIAPRSSLTWSGSTW